MKFAATVCLIGFVYQLGASPCGCLHENFWYLASVSIGQDTTHHGSADHGSADHGSDGSADHGSADHGPADHGPNDPCSVDPELPKEPALPHDGSTCDCSDLVYVTHSTIVWFELQQSQWASIDTSRSALEPFRIGNVNSIDLKWLVAAAPLRAHLGVFQL